MKKHALSFAVFGLVLLLLAGCGNESLVERRIPVSIRENRGFTVENNGQLILPGEDAVFLLHMDPELALMDTDYDAAEYKMLGDGRVQLTVKNVQYPTRVKLQLTSDFAVITYDANDGSGEVIALPHDTSLHSRPNTSNGVGVFEREGYTLESWNTRQDGTGERIGLASRVSVPDGELTLYAQWARWSAAADFDWTVTENTVTITGYHGSDPVVTVPAVLDGKPVTVISEGAFQNCNMTGVILPPSMVTVEDGAFRECSLETLTLSDNIETIGDKAFLDCDKLQTLRINAVEKPYGTSYRRESCYADKVDLLLQAQGSKKIVFYSGCSIWYNLDSTQLAPLVEQGYRPVNMGLNGLSNSALQMQIMGHFLEDGDILFHTPELSSETQMMLKPAMDKEDDNKLWCGLEYNYDLVTLVDMRTLPGLLDTFSDYLASKTEGTSYASVYMKDGNRYYDEYGTIPFYRDHTEPELPNRVYLDSSYINDAAMARLQAYYDWYQANGVRIYVSYACVNMDDVPEEQRNNVDMIEWNYHKAFEAMNGPVVISHLDDFLFHNSDYYDSNYHLRSETARENTRIWMRDLKAQMLRDGLWEEP